MPSPYLPAELLDDIVDLLRDNNRALRNCCLVSKSWIPRTRHHLFGNVGFFTEKDLKLWKKTFPDPSTSPASYTKSILIGSSYVLRGVDADGGRWLRSFSRVVHLRVKLQNHERQGSAIPLAAFHGFSPVIRSLDLSFITLPPSHIFDLILSFPLLEDLSLTTYGGRSYNDDGPGRMLTALRRPPKLNGTLTLFLVKGTEFVTPRLLSLRGIHFRGLTLTWRHEGDLSTIMALVEECTHTLESLHIERFLQGMSTRNLRAHR